MTIFMKCCTRHHFFIFFELSLIKTPSKDLFYVIANLFKSSLFLISYKHKFFELPPAITNIPFGDTESELKYLFFV